MGLSSLLKKAKKAVTKVSSSVSSAVNSVKTGITSTVSKGVSGIQNAVSGVKNFVSEGYLGAAVTGAIQGFASGGFAGMAVGAAAGVAAKKLASGSRAEETIDIGTTEGAEDFNLSTVDGTNAYFAANGYDLTVNDAGVVFANSTGEVVGQYNFSTYAIEPPTETTEKAGLSNVPAVVSAKSGVTSSHTGWKNTYNAVTKAYWTKDGLSGSGAAKVAGSVNAK